MKSESKVKKYFYVAISLSIAAIQIVKADNIIYDTWTLNNVISSDPGYTITGTFESAYDVQTGLYAFPTFDVSIYDPNGLVVEETPTNASFTEFGWRGYEADIQLNAPNQLGFFNLIMLGFTNPLPYGTPNVQDPISPMGILFSGGPSFFDADLNAHDVIGGFVTDTGGNATIQGLLSTDSVTVTAGTENNANANLPTNNFSLCSSGTTSGSPTCTDLSYWNINYNNNDHSPLANGALATVTLAIDPSLANIANEGIWHYNENTGQWEWLGGTINSTNDTITFQTSSFSPFELGTNPNISTTIPEPAPIVLLASAFLGFCVSRKIKESSKLEQVR